MPAGPKRHRFALDQPAGTPDAAGHVDLTDDANWDLVGPRWGTLIARGGGERFVFDQIAAEVSHLVELRNDSVTRTVHSTWRLRLGTRKFNIKAAYDPDGRRKQILVECIEVT